MTMAEKLLTDRKCKSVRPKASPYPISDGKGLRLVIHPNGSKYWVLRYTLAGRETTLGLGTYPAVTLEEARDDAAKVRKLVGAGISPRVDRKINIARNIERGEATFEAVANEWLARHKDDWSPHHYERNEGLLRRILYPGLGALPIAEITEPMLLTPLRKAYDSGIRESARRARAVASQVFAYAKDTHRATSNPGRELAASSVLKRPEVTHFAALKIKDVGPLLKKLDVSNLDPVTRAALLLMLFTGLRDFAMRGARWQEIDLKAAKWTVPAVRMKSRREHSVPLPKQAVSLLKELAKLTRKDASSFVFASRGKAGHLAENTLRLALHRLGFEVTAHGFRSLLTDLLNERGFNSDAIERQLDHSSKDKVRAAYLRSDFFDYRRRMMQWVADWAEAQRAGSVAPALPSNVLTIRRAA
jgi:integrase